MHPVILWKFSSCYVCLCFSVWSWAGTVSTWWSEETTGSSRCGALTTWTSCTPTLPVIAVCAHWPCHTIRGEIHKNLTRMHSSKMHTVRCSSRLVGVCLPGGVCCLPAGGCLPARGAVYTSLCEQTDTCENITFTQLLLRTVKMPSHFLWSLSVLNIRTYSYQAKAKKVKEQAKKIKE